MYVTHNYVCGRSSCKTAVRPRDRARLSGVRPLTSFASISAPFLRSSPTTASCPFSAARCSGV
ncbi:hypothetical protein BKA56DRAFT_583866 [Ilyonectria sp. MPI-CAGE-AT-0026]|nr:hypothetical protein BKA56DRAFT_583866 [Ilyonectria sp. MPI-CAGE-AT-0026]